MSRQVVKFCDICRKPTNRIVAKIQWIPATERVTHSNYSHHADVGECCVGLRRKINFRERVSFQDYQKQRRVS